MIKYYGTPITPYSVFDKYMMDRNVCISFLNPGNLKRAKDICNRIIIDNGAYTFFRKRIKPNWNKFYNFIDKHYKDIDSFFIPDSIDGTETDNNRLINEVPEILFEKAIPVYHLHESTERLGELMSKFDYIALGSSGDYWKIGSDKWHFRMNELMKIICNSHGRPKVKIHMLRCLNPNIFNIYPFYSGDSTGFAQNHHCYGAENILNRIENINSPDKYTFRERSYQLSIFT